MHEDSKYLIHADITASGVVERNDVVGAIFGQTEGLLGEELDLRELQDTSKVGRIDVDVASERGQSFGEITIASGLDRVETAILAASLETIDRVGPCRATIEVSGLEDVRSAKRRTVVDRATELLAEFEAETVTSRDIVDAVRERVRVEDLVEYEGVPAGPRIPESDAVVVVEGRADVLQLLEYGIKNAVAVEGTDVPDAVADLTVDRTTTAFLDGDRGGELILRELAQVGAVDSVAFAPAGTAVEDLSRDEALTALREKVPYDAVATTDADRPERTDVPFDDAASAVASDGHRSDDTPSDDTPSDDAPSDAAPGDVLPDDDRAVPADGGTAISAHTADDDGAPSETTAVPPAEAGTPAEASDASGPPESDDASADDAAVADAADDGRGTEDGDEAVDQTPSTVAGHVRTVLGEGRGITRLLAADATVIADGPADDVFDLLETADRVPTTVVVDAAVTQRVLDVAAQRGVEQVVGASEGEFVKRPTNVRVRTADDF